MQLMVQHGYAAVSMRQIASAVGVQAGALYTYTPDKQSLLYDLLADHMTELLAALDTAGIDEGRAVDRLERFTRFHIRFHLPRAATVFLSYMELRNLSAENFHKISALRRRYEAALHAILMAGVAEGSMSLTDCAVTTRAIIAMLTGISNWYRPDGALRPAEIEGIYVDLVRQTVGAVRPGPSVA